MKIKLMTKSMLVILMVKNDSFYKNKKLKTEKKYLKYFRTEDGSSGYLRLK